MVGITTSTANLAIEKKANPLNKAVLTFQALTNPFGKEKISFKGTQKPVAEWQKKETLGRLRFSDSSLSVQNPNEKERIKTVSVGKTPDGRHFIDLNSAMSTLGRIVLDKGVDPNTVQVGYQDNAGGFAVKIWDDTLKTAFILFDNGENNPAIAKAEGRFTAKLHQIGKKDVSFTGTVQNKLTEQDLTDLIENAYVVGMFGGFGTRLIGVSSPRTKPATKLGEKTLQNNMLSIVEKSGYKKVGCSLYHGADIAKADIEHGKHKMDISYAYQDEHTGNLGTAGAVRQTVEFMVADDFANKIRALSSEDILYKLNDLCSEDLAKDIWHAVQDAKEGHYAERLTELMPQMPELRARLFKEMIDKIPFIAVVSGDHVTDINMREFARTHLENNARFTLAVKEIDDKLKAQGGDQCPYGCAVIPDIEDGQIIKFKEKPYWKQNSQNSLPDEKIYKDLTDRWINTGIYILSPAALKKIPSEADIKALKAQKGETAKAEGSDFGINIIPQLLKEYGALQGYRSDRHWVDVGNNMALQQEVGFLVNNIYQNEGQTTLLPGQHFDFRTNAAISTKAECGKLDIENDAKVLISNANVGDVKLSGTVYIGADANVPSGTYQNVWIDRLRRPLFPRDLDVTA